MAYQIYYISNENLCFAEDYLLNNTSRPVGGNTTGHCLKNIGLKLNQIDTFTQTEQSFRVGQ